MTKRPKTTVSCQCPEDVKQMYNKLYPQTLSRFLVNCIRKAVNDKNFFIDIFFGEV